MPRIVAAMPRCLHHAVTAIVGTGMADAFGLSTRCSTLLIKRVGSQWLEMARERGTEGRVPQHTAMPLVCRGQTTHTTPDMLLRRQLDRGQTTRPHHYRSPSHAPSGHH